MKNATQQTLKASQNIADDKQLAADLRSDSKYTQNKALEAIMTKYSNNLFARLLKSTRDKSVAEDLLQETFSKIFRSIHTYDHNKSAFSTFLFKICENTLIDHYRVAKNFKPVSFTELTNDLNRHLDNGEVKFEVHEETTSEKSVLDKEIMEVVERALEKTCNDNEKSVFRAIFIDHLKYEEAASELDMPIGTIKTCIYRARMSVRGYIRKFYKGFEFAV